MIRQFLNDIDLENFDTRFGLSSALVATSSGQCCKTFLEAL